MTRATIAGGTFVAALVLLVVLVVRNPAAERVDSTPAPAGIAASTTEPAAATHQGFLYGRIADVDGATYQGRLRWGRDQEAFWGDYFNGLKSENPWAVHAPLDRPSQEGRRIEIFGFEIGGPDHSRFRRLFMARFGDIARIDAHMRDVQVTLKSGTVVGLDRFAAGDIDDGVRVWDGRRGIVDLDTGRIRTIEFLPTAQLGDAPDRMHGTVRTWQGDFTGFIQWNQQDGAGTDELTGRSTAGEVRLRYDAIRSIARHSADRAVVRRLDGREMVLSDTQDVGRGNRGIYVDDPRYGRVLISWDAFERVDFSAGGRHGAYGDFPPGRALAGSVTTRDGRRLAGRLVYDFDESETTETLDASLQRVDYNIPFSLITSIVPTVRGAQGIPRATVILRGGQELQLEPTGDLGPGNAGMLIFVEGRQRPEYVPWTEVQQIDFDAPPAKHLPAGER
jgi:hypothetical protein